MMNQKPRPYREITIPAMVFGVIFGVLLTACFTYAGLLMGFTIGGSAVAAILGFGVLRGVLGKGTIVENNINQTIASAINITTPGVIFTIPAFYLMGIDFNPYIVCLAAIAGALLGILFIIPIRKQMIDLERLRFPTGTAVATVLKSPGAGVEKSVLLLIGMIVSAGVYFLSQFPIRFYNDSYLFGIPFGIIPSEVDLRPYFGLPPDIVNIWAISMFSLGAGFISGRPGLVVLAGGILAYWIITPMATLQTWIPSDISVPFHTSRLDEARFDEHVQLGRDISNWVHSQINRPLGIGMLIGGALIGILLSLPAIKASIVSLRRIELKNTSPEELPLKYLLCGIIAAFILLFIATYFTAPIGVFRSLMVAGFGTLWLAFAGVVVAQATGMTDWSPISGMALLGVVIVLMMTNHSVESAIVIGVAIAVAVSCCADMMQDLKTGYMVGAIPIRQQIMELCFCAIGPVVCLTVMTLLWHSFGFGPGKELSAPQAQALQATIESMQGGNVPWAKYLCGAIIAGVLSFTGIPGIGVLMGLSMYLPIEYILPYGLGCFINMSCSRTFGARWVEDKGIPVAAGLLVGEPLIVVCQSILIICQVIQPPG